MVVARRGQHEVKVSKRSYETLFKNKGYKLVGEERTNTASMMDEDFDEEVETVPISEMNKEQLAEYAKEHNIDTSSARNVREARQIIQKAIRDSKM